jgi:hypothetical protein
MAHVKLHHSLTRAHQVLRAANAIGFKLNKDTSDRFSVQSWDNGREQGLVIMALLVTDQPGVFLQKVGVFIAEARSSDGTIVVVDPNMVMHCNNEPTEKAWEDSRTYFNIRQTKQAARHVVKAVNALAKLHKEQE